jgi:phosphate transport system permease protein
MSLTVRHRLGRLWHWIFLFATVIGVFSLMLMLYNIVNEGFGYAVIQPSIDPALVLPRPMDQLSDAELITVIEDNLSKGAYQKADSEKPFVTRSRAERIAFVEERVLEEKVAASWSLTDSILNGSRIRAEAAKNYPQGRLKFLTWLNSNFVTLPMSSNALYNGIRTAILGSFFVVLLTIVIAFPIGVGAAIYLEEYAGRSWVNRLIQTNIDNLAGVPSIVYGMLGLAIFVRMLAPLTSGAIFGVADSNGRTILSASATMALLILPIIIINAQEAIRAVPNSLRQASYGLGATQWQTIWHHILPNALPGILTGAILSISRALGETAPLIIIGASTFIAFDPDSVFAKFTVLPIQIYNFTQQPQDEYRNLAAAAILILLTLLLTLNSAAILLRNRFSQRL